MVRSAFPLRRCRAPASGSAGKAARPWPRPARRKPVRRSAPTARRAADAAGPAARWRACSRARGAAAAPSTPCPAPR
ncbi:hypothetical protein G6F54_014490 [Rhizopus delemar]|nr:hypothetical protein G6F54_014490 [Rhizopus delemar]